MTKFFAGLFVLALAVGLGFAMPSFAQEDANQGASQPDAASGEDTTKDETLLEKLEEDFKETTTPTDEETDPIGTNEDADRDLY
jgi:uncharacterized protein HemX